MGRESKLKAALAGDQEGKPPHRVPWRQGEPATKRASPPLGTIAAVAVSAVNGLMPGCRGRSPRQNKLIVAPFPPGRGGGGMGADK